MNVVIERRRLSLNDAELRRIMARMPDGTLAALQRLRDRGYMFPEADCGPARTAQRVLVREFLSGEGLVRRRDWLRAKEATGPEVTVTGHQFLEFAGVRP